MAMNFFRRVRGEGWASPFTGAAEGPADKGRLTQSKDSSVDLIVQGVT